MAAIKGKISRRYARALSELSANAQEMAALAKNLEEFSNLIETHPSLKQVFLSPVFSPQQKEEVMSDLIAKLAIKPPTSQALKYLSMQDRLDYLPVICEELAQMNLEKENGARIEIETPSELNPDQKKEIIKKFEKILGKKIEPTYTLDPSLMAGVRVKAAGKVFDGTVAGWMTQFKEETLRGEF
jgi:F-type H+-transporting ATPase subunit delta